MEFKHIPVLYNQCLDGLKIKPNGIYLDGTFGGGGHSRGIHSNLTTGILICVDKDIEALKASKSFFETNKNVIALHSDYKYALDKLADLQGVADNSTTNTTNAIDTTTASDTTTTKASQQALKAVQTIKALQNNTPLRLDGVLLDLGVSSYQIDNAARGFSYMNDAPLDMRMDTSASLSAYNVVNNYSASQLTKIIRDYGEEKFASKIANAIVRARGCKKSGNATPIKTTLELSNLIKNTIPKAVQFKANAGGHPAKRTFQAIRIYVNGELDSLYEVIQNFALSLNTGGRMCVITFHSLEDRLVKQAFADLAKGCVCDKKLPICICKNKPKIKLINTKPILPSIEELAQNKRASSAKLRVVEKI
ncbi:MAG: 16S rRNA (cytosine(1402)-N(4))-methyltransferase RsmH [Firmicutes bacterium]|nr:16S rRNA (cytosine(1402)-N(4))-methyltransferase RsmH [Bacillota bacterium]